jgi:aminopeptidase N
MAIRYAHDSLHGLPRFCTHSVELQAKNPQVASRIARSFDRWKQFDAGRQAHARAALERIRGCAGLAKDVAEVVDKALGPSGGS